MGLRSSYLQLFSRNKNRKKNSLAFSGTPERFEPKPSRPPETCRFSFGYVKEPLLRRCWSLVQFTQVPFRYICLSHCHILATCSGYQNTNSVGFLLVRLPVSSETATGETSMVASLWLTLPKASISHGFHLQTSCL